MKVKYSKVVMTYCHGGPLRTRPWLAQTGLSVCVPKMKRTHSKGTLIFSRLLLLLTPQSFLKWAPLFSQGSQITTTD